MIPALSRKAFSEQSRATPFNFLRRLCQSGYLTGQSSDSSPDRNRLNVSNRPDEFEIQRSRIESTFDQNSSSWPTPALTGRTSRQFPRHDGALTTGVVLEACSYEFCFGPVSLAEDSLVEHSLPFLLRLMCPVERVLPVYWDV